MVEGRDLFVHLRSANSDYDVRAHLGEMIALLGPPPKKLIDRELSWSKVKWSHAVSNPEGKLSQTTREYFGGLFFTSDGEFMHKGLIPSDVSLEDSVSALQGREKEDFLDFVRMMLHWLPEERKSARDLLEHPWLQEGSG
jgi:serine/threonine protein kinase